MRIKTIKGFTILELLVVIAILGIFTVVAYPNISKWIDDRAVKKDVYDVINYIGIKEHYFSLNQGIISAKDISYFFALNYLFIHLSIIYLNKIKKWLNNSDNESLKNFYWCNFYLIYWTNNTL